MINVEAGEAGGGGLCCASPLCDSIILNLTSADDEGNTIAALNREEQCKGKNSL